MKWTHERKLITAFWLAFALLVCLRLISLQSDYRVVEASTLSAHTHKILGSLADLESDLFAVETSRRGYVITGIEGFLEQYTNAAVALEKIDLPRLYELITEDSPDRAALDQLNLLVRLTRSQLEKSIALRRTHRKVSPEQIAFTAEGKELMERVEEKIAGIREAQTALLDLRSLDVQSRLQQRTMLSIALSVIDLFLLIFAYRSLSRYIRERKRIEQVLYEESLLRAAIVSTQYEIATAGLDLGKILKLVVNHAQELTRAEGAMIKLLRAPDLVCDVASGKASGGLGSKTLVKESLAGWVLESGQTFRTGEIKNDPRARRDYGEFGISSLVITNLFHGNRSVGVLEVVSSRAQAFGEREVQTLEFMAGLIAAAMTNAANYELAQSMLASRTA
ncbi:MAG: CHASE3 domain-containing protein [Verrucomicrobiota bacterium]